MTEFKYLTGNPWSFESKFGSDRRNGTNDFNSAGDRISGFRFRNGRIIVSD